MAVSFGLFTQKNQKKYSANQERNLMQLARSVKARMRSLVMNKMFILIVINDFFVKRAFMREMTAVYSGMRQHHQERSTLTAVAYVRRHVHMVEKGLSMKPRRETFAVDYVSDLVDSIITTDRLGLLDFTTSSWISDVMESYFLATQDSDSDAIFAARMTYREFVRTRQFGNDVYSGRTLSFTGPRPAGSPAITVEIGDLEKLVEQRTSVRWFTDKTVDRSVVDRALMVGIQAPSACNRLPYRFLILDNQDHAKMVAKLPGGTVGYADNIQNLIVVVGDLSSYAHTRDRHLIYIDSSLAVMGLLLAMEAQQVATCCINWPDSAKPDAEIAALLGLKGHERTIMLIAYGYRDEAGLVPGSGKKNIETVRNYGMGLES